MLKADFTKLKIISEADVRDLGFRDQREFYLYILLYYDTMDEANAQIMAFSGILSAKRYINSDKLKIRQKEIVEQLKAFYDFLFENYDKMYTMNPEFDSFISSILNAPSVFAHWKEPYPTGRVCEK